MLLWFIVYGARAVEMTVKNVCQQQLSSSGVIFQKKKTNQNAETNIDSSHFT